MKPFKKTVFLGITDQGCLAANINFDGENLSITGNEGREHGGQIIMSEWRFLEYAQGHNAETVEKLRDIWQKWHLNDMQGGSPAQTAFLKANPVPRVGDYFTQASHALKGAGLNPDPNFLHEGKPYRYGTAWLRVDVPKEVLTFLNNLN